ncbi:D-aspartate oxidase-like [Mytilus californianus]|uniref:D-aspartate oxidase-like n=1 Tax=Mytilus californianus TaxID=6549 RepID=UPI0022459D00|nr:D-aspartate oxidase-like [Mytilus californianus]
MPRIAVLGAGVIGLSTAVSIRKSLPSASIVIIADKFGSETTSYGAGGLSIPTVDKVPGVPKDLVRRWVSDSWKWFSDLTLSDLASTTGNQLAPGYFLCNTPLIDPLFAEYVYSYERMSDEELKKINMQAKYKYGYRVTSIITCLKKYLPWLTKLHLDGGGIIEGRKIENLNELVGTYDVVVNCTGLGSRKLLNDGKIHSNRGQIIELHADWIKYWIYTDDGAYLLPYDDIVKIGGVRQMHNYNIEVDENDQREIKEKCYRLWPPLQGADIVKEWVGLRPTRTPLRLEAELIKFPTGKLKVVHNYGHGGVGIAISWGTSLHAAKLVKDILQSESRL